MILLKITVTPGITTIVMAETTVLTFITSGCADEYITGRNDYQYFTSPGIHNRESFFDFKSVPVFF